MSSAVEFLARNPATNPDTAPPAYDLAAFEKRLGNLERTSQLERRVAELERQNAKTQELASGLLALLWGPRGACGFLAAKLDRLVHRPLRHRRRL